MSRLIQFRRPAATTTSTQPGNIAMSQSFINEQNKLVSRIA